MRIEEFESIKKWWGDERKAFDGRSSDKHSWRVDVENIRARNYNLDVKNPHVINPGAEDPEVLLNEYFAIESDIGSLRNQLKLIICDALQGGRSS